MSELRSETEISRILLRTPILMYHKVDVRNEVGINAIHPEKFRQQITFLVENGYQTITFQDLLYGSALPPKPLILTFDDGYECIYEHAFPVLRAAGYRAIIYIVTGFMGKMNQWDANLGGIRFRHLARAQLQEMDRAGWELGSHGVTHRALTRLGSKQVAKELVQSKMRLSVLSRRPVVSLAYPFGLHNHAVQAAARAAGYYFGCTGIHAGRRASLLSIQRVPVYQLEGPGALSRKLQCPLPRWERIKLSLLHLPARLIPLYQQLFKGQLFLDL